LVGHEDILRFEIAVYDAPLVHALKPFAELNEVAEVPDDVGRLFEAVAQILAVKELHRDEADLVVRADVVEGNDVRVRDLAAERELLLEARQHRRVGDAVAKQLDRDGLVELEVLGLIDDRHASAADLLADAVAVRDDEASAEVEDVEDG